MNEQLSNTVNSIVSSTKGLVNVFVRYRFIIVFIIASMSVLAALLQSGSYLNPPRNENRYNDEKLKINYSSIDQEIVKKLEATQNDIFVEVDANLAPNRNNPFRE